MISRRRALAMAVGAVGTALVTGCGVNPARGGLYVTDPDGAPRWIAETTGAPAWSPAGDAIAWGDEYGLRMSSNTVDDQINLTALPMVGRPTWSPDGTSIAFLNSASRALQRVDVVSQEVTTLASLFEGTDGVIRPPIVTRGGPAWSPDGARIAFICWDGFGDELCLVDSAGGAAEQVTTLGLAEERAGNAARSSVTSVAWSSDSSALAVTVQAEQQGAAAGVYRVELVRRASERISKLTTNAPLVWDAASDDLFFSARVEGRSDVYRMSAAGGKTEALTAELADGAREPTVSGDGDLALVSGRSVLVMRQGSDETQTVEEAGLVTASPALSGNEGRLAFLALPRPIERYP